MPDKISDYPSALAVHGQDKLDKSNTNDGGSTYNQSESLTVDQLMNYINSNVENLYNADGSILVDRTITSDGTTTTWDGGNLALKSDGLLDNGLVLFDSLGAFRGGFAYDVGIDSGNLDLWNASGSYFLCSDGETRASKFSSNYTGTMGNYSVIIKGFTGGTNNFMRLEAGTLDGKIEFGTSLDNPNIEIYDKTGSLVTNIDSGSSSTYFLRPIGINMTGGTARLSVKALGTGTDQVQRWRNSGDTDNLAVIQGNGNFGIGTGTPLKTFHVSGESQFDGDVFNPSSQFFLGGGIVSSVGNYRMRVDGVSGQGVASFRSDAGTSLLTIDDDATMIINGSNPDSNMNLGVTSGNAKMRIRSKAADVYQLRIEKSDGAFVLTTAENGRVNMSSLPTSSVGLAVGDLWNNAGVINIV